MTCRETLTLDLAEFLTRATAPEFAAFRAHYPRCADCAAEVRAWTELHAALSASAHPSPDTLLRYEDARLAESERRVVAQHLAACAPCRDELRALAVFDREAARVARARVPERPRWFRLPELGRLVLHPVLAYGLVLALLFYPALTGRQQAPESSVDRVTSSDEAKIAAEPRLADRSSKAPREERAVAPERQPAAEVDGGVANALKERAPQAPPPAAFARAKREASEREPNAAPLARLGAAQSASTAGDALSLASNVRPRLDAMGTADQVTLRIPVRAVGPLEVRVLPESGERELRERVTSAADRVEVRVPRAWLVPGGYRVEVRAVGAGAATDVFAFDVGS